MAIYKLKFTEEKPFQFLWQSESKGQHPVVSGRGGAELNGKAFSHLRVSYYQISKGPHRKLLEVRKLMSRRRWTGLKATENNKY